MRQTMSEKLLKFLASELMGVRVHCPNKKCGTVVELSLKRLEKGLEDADCPACGTLFDGQGLKRLGEALHGFADPKAGLKVEFVIPAKD
jgi:hypothetical protein